MMENSDSPNSAGEWLIKYPLNNREEWVLPARISQRALVGSGQKRASVAVVVVAPPPAKQPPLEPILILSGGGPSSSFADLLQAGLRKKDGWLRKMERERVGLSGTPPKQLSSQERCWSRCRPSH